MGRKGIHGVLPLQVCTDTNSTHKAEGKLSELLINEPDRKVLLLGSEGLVRGALEARLALASSYPDTPSSEVPNNRFMLKEKAGLYMKFTTNEKVAMEVAGAAALSGVRSLTAMKHVGMNVVAQKNAIQCDIAGKGIGRLSRVMAYDPAMDTVRTGQP